MWFPIILFDCKRELNQLQFEYIALGKYKIHKIQVYMESVFGRNTAHLSFMD